ncbi:Oidioi.mRNA.OKI2018_I69.chr1.g1014.t1.cds [Oikopleura dioica]|uniref:Oidioi.mRNA.OKI2018_I69.chr1.g1014.t1.cds n=1 Tax=Oikopleura dioica TaxID=34765 RepID=A0ABN7SND4_OIKDI|nr:Oidioi.mRNA.OKI2018_I69.chr1.g1014.t1.cds [Oikopleura dioica]
MKMKNESLEQFCWDQEGNFTQYRDHKVEQIVSGNIAGVSLIIAIYLFCALSVYSFRFGEFSPFKPKLRRVSFALLLLVSFLDIILCSFLVWSNYQQNMSHLKCRVTEKISQACFNLFRNSQNPKLFLKPKNSNVIFITTFYFIYLFLWLRQNKFYQDPILSDNFPEWSRKLNKFTLAAIIFVVTASNITVAPHFFDPKVIICGKRKENGYFEGICFQDDDEWSLWLGLGSMVFIQSLLLFLFLYPLKLHPKHISATNPLQQEGMYRLLRRCTILATCCTVTDLCCILFYDWIIQFQAKTTCYN